MIFRRPFVKRFALSYRTVVCTVCPVLSVCDVGVLWPNGWMDQDETWHAGGPRPQPHCVGWVPSSPSKKRTQPPIQFSAHVYCDHGRPSQLLLSSCYKCFDFDFNCGLCGWCRSVGTFAMVLQQLVSSGQLRVSDCMLDDNNIVLKVRLCHAPQHVEGCQGQKPARPAGLKIGPAITNTRPDRRRRRIKASRCESKKWHVRYLRQMLADFQALFRCQNQQLMHNVKYSPHFERAARYNI